LALLGMIIEHALDNDDTASYEAIVTHEQPANIIPFAHFASDGDRGLIG
jgi:hypothetical protein